MLKRAQLDVSFGSLRVSNQLANVTGTLRLSAPPNISDTLITPLVTAFQASYPNVRVHILIAALHRRWRRHRISASHTQGFIAGGAKDIELPASTRSQPGLFEDPRSAGNPARSAAPPVGSVLARQAGRQPDLRSCQRQGRANPDVPFAPNDE